MTDTSSRQSPRAAMAPLLPGGTPVESLLHGAQFSTPGRPTPDYHGVNFTGSCSWKVYVKGGIIIWETQQTDYPSVGPDSPEYEPRGCPRGTSFSSTQLQGGRKWRKIGVPY